MPYNAPELPSDIYPAHKLLPTAPQAEFPASTIGAIDLYFTLTNYSRQKRSPAD